MAEQSSTIQNRVAGDRYPAPAPLFEPQSCWELLTDAGACCITPLYTHFLRFDRFLVYFFGGGTSTPQKFIFFCIK
jgi:hypothetical protein